jgi:DNA polymerase-1
VAEPGPLLIVDGDALAHRAYHALPPLTGSTGRPIGLLQGTVSMLVAAWDLLAPRAMAVAFDCRLPSPRHAAWPGYQGQREAFDDDLVEQLDLLPGLVGAFGVPALTAPPWEADDVCATLVALEEAADGKALVLTHDRDAFQLASDQTSVVRPLSGMSEVEVVDPAGVAARYGVRPALVPDLIALRGDPSDNLPGARGIGQKTAAALLGRYGGLEAVIANAHELTPAKARAVTDSADELRVFREIATMRRDLPLERPRSGAPDWAAGAEACAAAGMGRLAERLAARA